MRAAKIDANQSAIVAALRDFGCTVQSLATVGKGVPDLLVGAFGVNVLMEIKDGAKPPSARKLTKDEAKWHQDWTGQVAIVESVEQALNLIVNIRTQQERRQ